MTILQGDELECPDQPRPVAAVHHPRPGRAAPRLAAGPGSTERSANGIVTGPDRAGYAAAQKDGRRNRYQIQAHLPLPEPASQEPAIGGVLAIRALSRPRAAASWNRSRRTSCSAGCARGRSWSWTCGPRPNTPRATSPARSTCPTTSSPPGSPNSPTAPISSLTAGAATACSPLTRYGCCARLFRPAARGRAARLAAGRAAGHRRSQRMTGTAGSSHPAGSTPRPPISPRLATTCSPSPPNRATSGGRSGSLTRRNPGDHHPSWLVLSLSAASAWVRP